MMSFLRRFFRSFGRSPTHRVIAETVDSIEQLTRFVFQSNHVHSSGRLKPAALMPEKTPGPHGLETSVCRIDGLSEQGIWQIGKDDVGRLRDKPPVARGDFAAQRARDCKLDVVADKQSFERHALLIKWPTAKEDQIAIAQELSRYTGVKKPL